MEFRGGMAMEDPAATTPMATEETQKPKDSNHIGWFILGL